MKIGILGGGQLAQMMAQAAKHLGHSVRVYSDHADCPAKTDAEVFVGGFENTDSIDDFCKGLDVVTYEWENIPISFARAVEKRVKTFYPAVSVLEMAKDRFLQKSFFNEENIPTAPYALMKNKADLEGFGKKHGFPFLLKTCLSGYDGKGQLKVKSESEMESASIWIGNQKVIAEAFVNFGRELSLVACQNKDGLIFYPLVENVHQEGILRTTLAPAPSAQSLQKKAEAIATQFVQKTQYQGVFTIEFFQVGDALWINELATRVHNTGHWTIEGANCSQFESHMRVGLGLAVPVIALKRLTFMINLIGTVPDLSEIKKIAGVTIHLYGKLARAGRKLGHITICADKEVELKRKVEETLKLLEA